MRMKDKVLQLVTDGVRVLDAEAIIQQVRLIAGQMYGKYEGREVVSFARGIWKLV